MRSSGVPLFRFFILALAVVSAAMPILAQCPQEVPAEFRGDITPNGPVIAAQCPEACPNFFAGQYVSYGWTSTGLDFIEVQCSDATAKVAKIYSTPQPDSTASVCWNCVEGCGTNCPPGELCMPVPWSSGSDCKRFGCPAGYNIVERHSDAGKEEPYCVRDPAVYCPTTPQPPPLVVVLEGPEKIRTGGECSWSAVAYGGTGAPKTYSWSVSNNPAGDGPYYTGGRPSGTLVGYSWRLRVYATDGTKSATQEIIVSEDPNAPFCAQ